MIVSSAKLVSTEKPKISPVSITMSTYNAVKVFTATRAKERESLGEVMSAWLKQMADKIQVVDTKVLQSSDQQFHCLTMIVFYREL